MRRGFDPIRDLIVLQDRMNRLFEETTAAQQRTNDERTDEHEIEHADWIPAADVYEREKEYLVALDLPGIDRSALEINLDEGQLMIRGAREAEEEGQRRSERPHGRFLRRFGIPTNVDQKAIAAEYKDGVLRLRLPKRQAEKTRRVEIKVS